MSSIQVLTLAELMTSFSDRMKEIRDNPGNYVKMQALLDLVEQSFAAAPPMGTEEALGEPTLENLVSINVTSDPEGSPASDHVSADDQIPPGVQRVIGMALKLLELEQYAEAKIVLERLVEEPKSGASLTSAPAAPTPYCGTTLLESVLAPMLFAVTPRRSDPPAAKSTAAVPTDPASRLRNDLAKDWAPDRDSPTLEVDPDV